MSSPFPPRSSQHLMKALVATSNAPTIGRKRKLSDEDEDVQESGSTRKRRGQLEHQDASELGELGAKGRETDPGVKEVTRGVKVVELEDEKQGIRTDDARGSAIEEASETVDGESSVTVPLDPAHAPHHDDQDVTATDDEVPAGQSEAIAEASPSGDEPGVEAPTSTDTEGPPSSLAREEKEEAPSDTIPEAGSKESAEVGETAEPIQSRSMTVSVG
jgi:hypothetical protein